MRSLDKCFLFSFSCLAGDGPTPQPNKCYMCSSEKSWDYCENVKQEKLCPYNKQGSCGEAVIQGNRDGQPVKIYVKDYVATSLCHPDDCKLYYPSLKNTTCDLQCCTGDLCNNNTNIRSNNNNNDSNSDNNSDDTNNNNNNNDNNSNNNNNNNNNNNDNDNNNNNTRNGDDSSNGIKVPMVSGVILLACVLSAKLG